jgi:glycosyltransferase involved in cell wall biosynthesis
MRVAILDPIGAPYDGNTPYIRGLGGSESAIVFIARELAKLGITVDVFCDCDRDVEVDDVFYFNRLNMGACTFNEYDIVISSRSVAPFVNYKIKGHKVLWLHDTFCDGDEMMERLFVNGYIDELWTLSDWHTSYIQNCNHGHRRSMEVLKRKTWVTRNGANIWDVDVDIYKKDPDLFIFNAAANKGMNVLLERVWPRVHALSNGKAKLTIIGGSYHLRNPDIQNDRVAQLQKEHDGKLNVSFTGYITQQEVAEHLAKASFMLYPQELPETYGISTLESLVYGTPVISGRFGAMEETAVDQACYLMDYPVTSNVLNTFDEEAHLEVFIDLVGRAYLNRYLWQQKAEKALEVREVCEWSKVAKQWKQHLYRVTGRYMTRMEQREALKITYDTNRIFGRRWQNPEDMCPPASYYNRRMMVVVTCYNAEKYIKKCLDSINNQLYDYYDVYVVDDASTDDTYSIIEDCSYINYHMEKNDERVGALANQLAMISQYGREYDIIVIIDGDDALTNDPHIFSRINDLYSQGYKFTYGSCWSMADNIPLIAQEYPDEVKDNRSYKSYHFPWKIPYTHLRTFSSKLIDSIDYNNLRDGDGNIYKAAGDSALFYELIRHVEPRAIKAVRDVTYLYNDTNPINDYKVNSEEQTRNSNEIIMGKQPKIPSKKKILCAIPTAQNIHAETFKSIFDLEVPDGYELHFQYFYGYCIDQVRNLIADWVVRGYDYLFAVDYDISFPPTTLKTLIETDRDVVSGLYIQRIEGTHTLELYRTDPAGSMYNVPLESLSNGDVHEVDGVGFGCVLVKAEVFRAIGYPYFTYHHALDIKDTISEDVDFCMKAKSKGFTIVANSKVVCDHHGKRVFQVNARI